MPRGSVSPSIRCAAVNSPRLSKLTYFLELVASGLTRGSIYALIALGYTMVYGIVQLINFAHGEIYMLGAFIALIVTGVLTFHGFSGWAILLLAALLAALYAAAYGYTLERIAYRPLRGAPRLSPLISAIGMSLFLQNYVMLAQTPDFLPFPALIPDFAFMEPVAHIIGSAEVVILATSALLMIGLTVMIRATRIGKAMRATQQDMAMARLVGIDVDRIISFTFMIGSVLAAIGGVLVGSYLGQINFAIGFMAGIKAFTAAVLGGIGSIPGAMLGGLVLGLSEALAAGYVSSAYEDVFTFGLLVLILVLRPSGLLGRAVREKV